ncbi:DUF805 domain-containing protein [Flexibacterium corallicola]|uniref:DUF805 domain-containing protein n=1 Tax=Flexibacterium corallicola TaxID=3037259 RepID=UPI00386211E4
MSYVLRSLALVLLTPVVGLFIVAGTAIQTQRIRVFNFSGWFVLVSLISYIGWIFSLAILFVPGSKGLNNFGADPREILQS